jgi:hypothetical protein
MGCGQNYIESWSGLKELHAIRPANNRGGNITRPNRVLKNSPNLEFVILTEANNLAFSAG